LTGLIRLVEAMKYSYEIQAFASITINLVCPLNFSL
jgi:hypothetical protein